jgi:hypothetical protein
MDVSPCETGKGCRRWHCTRDGIAGRVGFCSGRHGSIERSARDAAIVIQDRFSALPCHHLFRYIHAHSPVGVKRPP